MEIGANLPIMATLYNYTMVKISDPKVAHFQRFHRSVVITVYDPCFLVSGRMLWS